MSAQRAERDLEPDAASEASGGDAEERYEFGRAAEEQLFGDAYDYPCDLLRAGSKLVFSIQY